MRSENIIEILFEAARSEKPVRDLSHVKKFIQKDTVGTQSSLVTKWLKQNKMNILITTSGILITTTAFLFLQREISETPITNQVIENPAELVPVAEEQADEPEEFIKEVIPKNENSGDDIENEVVTESDEREEVVENPASSSGKVSNQSKPSKPPYTFKNVDPVKTKVSEHSIVLESSGGRQSADRFDAYLQRNLSKLNPKFTSSASSSSIRKFTLSLDNRAGADFRMQITGSFERLELHWNTDSKNEISNMWYKLDSNERGELDLSKGVESSIKVKRKRSGS